MDSAKTTPRRTAQIRVVMNRSFIRFSDDELAEFVNDLATLAGCSSDEIVVTSVRRGCVLVEARIGEVEAEKILDLFNRLRRTNIPDDSELEALRAFVKKHLVSNMSGEFEVRLQIINKNAKKKHEDRHVVFVHGWRGDDRTFGDLPGLIGDTLSCNTSIYPYPTGIWKQSPSLIWISRNLDNWVRNLGGARRLAFVAHSYGGLIVRKMLVLQRSYPEPIDQRTSQVIFVASPHNGAALASLGGLVPTIQKEQLSELSSDSAILFELNSDWQEWVSRMAPTPCSIRSLIGLKDSVVSTASAQGLDPQAIPMLERTHTNIVEVTSATDEVFLTIKRLLEESTFLKTLTVPPSLATRERTTRGVAEAIAEGEAKVADRVDH
jgi:pimeloyl-ACP methyl ester carboxylesterase